MKSGVFYGFLETIPILVIWRRIFRLWRRVCPYTALVGRRRTFHSLPFFHQLLDTFRVIEVLFELDPQHWHVVPMKPGSSDTLGRVEIVVISILVMLVLGLLAVAFVPESRGTPSRNQPSH